MTRNCRICGSSLLECNDQLILPDCPLTDEFVNTNVDNTNAMGYVSTIRIIRCNHCNTVQNPFDFNYSSYYTDYEYTSALSLFTKSFMERFAEKCISLFFEHNERYPISVVEPGSGNGEQLKFFKQSGMEVKGVEPSRILARTAESYGINTDISLFDREYSYTSEDRYDICISSYTLDHCPDPVDYIIAANKILNLHGILAFEIHDLSKIVERAEYCLFEHEHTIYLTLENAKRLVEACGFSVLAVNPIDERSCRANSLILIARKIATCSKFNTKYYIITNREPRVLSNLINLERRISRLICSVDKWIESTDELIVGYGAGGRGIMTLAQLRNFDKFRALLDIAYENRNFKTPKTLIPVVGPEYFHLYNDHSVLVFSFGYYDEIREALLLRGFDPSRIKSLKDFMLSI